MDARTVRRWCALAAEALGRERGRIDALNVFPVPDGDTGTNLHLTVLAAGEEVAALPEDADRDAAWRALARGALLGARGNSGVILSQVLRGMADALGVGEGLPAALRHASALAHDAVAHPVRGTMLSVLRAAADSCADGVDVPAVARLAAERARAELGETTAQLDVLARHGVVDAGAAGLCVVLDALAAALNDRTDPPPPRADPPPARGGDPTSIVQRGKGTWEGEHGPVDNSGGSYEVMYLLDADDGGIPGLRAELDRLGDSLIVVGGDGLWNVHVHADDAGAAVEAGLRAGRPHRIRVSCLHASAAGRGVVAVTSGDGLAELFRRHGATVVRREDGVTHADLAEAIARAGDEVIVLPGDDAVLAMARRLRDARAEVVPARATVQSLAALAVHDPGRPFEDDVRAMARAAGATRFGGLLGDGRGLIGGEVAAAGGDQAAVATRTLDRMLSTGGELVTLVLGAEARDGLADAVRDHLRRRHPQVEVAVYDGGQPRWPLLIGVE